jgi:hypothetical protein
MCLPASHFLDGEINYENMGIGKLAPVSWPLEALHQCLLVLSQSWWALLIS